MRGMRSVWIPVSFLVLATGTCAAQSGSAAPPTHEKARLAFLENGVQFRADGAEPVVGSLHNATVRDGILDLTDPRGQLTFPGNPQFGATSAESFALEIELRAEPMPFATVLMCREGSSVHYSLVVGREEGRASFELWNWSRERVTTRQRIDDGVWRRLTLVHDARLRLMALFVDGELHDCASVSGEFRGSPAPGLRLGHNLDEGVDQPFRGEIRALAWLDGVPEDCRRPLADFVSARLLPPGSAENAVREWNDSLRRRRTPPAERTALVERSARVRAQIQDALGLWPAPGSGRRLAGALSPLSGGAGEATDFASFRSDLPLELRTGGRLEREGHTLTRVAWQSFPGYDATGWLYEPLAPVERPRAAVLCPHGHWADGARHPVVQARCVTLAQAGYVVLAVDSVHFEAPELGVTSLSLMTWNNLRALELLRARDDVDPARIASTGASGGGQQTYYLTALRTGLAAAAPVVMAAHFGEILPHDGVHCRCNHVAHAARAADMPEFAAAFAPVPQLFVTVEGDWTHRFLEEGYPEVQEAYSVLGAGELVSATRDPGGHRFDRAMRNRVYAFLDQHLRGIERPPLEREEVEAKTESLATLAALDAGLGARTDPRAVVPEFRARLAAPAVSGSHDEGRIAEVGRRLAALLRVGPRRDMEVRAVETEVAGCDGAFLLRAEDSTVTLPVLRLAQPSQVLGTTIVLDDRGKSTTLTQRRGWLTALREAGQQVLLVDVRYLGELDVGRGYRGYHGRFFGEEEGQLAVRDLIAVLDAESLGAAHGSVTVLGFGPSAGAVAVLAAVVDPRIDRVCAPELGRSWAAGDRRPQLSRILLHGDLPDVVAFLGRRARVGGVPDAGDYGVAVSRGARVQMEPLGPGDLVRPGRVR